MSTEKVRILTVAVLALSLLVAIAILRPRDKHGIPESTFWQNKFSGPAEFDIVAAGDSRILHGVNVEEFENAGLGKALNFGFRGTPANEEYFSMAAERLGDGDKQKILVLGITPNGFTANAVTTNGFNQKLKDFEAAKKSRFSTPVWFAAIEQRFEPAKLAEMMRVASRRKNPLQETYYPNGWIESSHQKPNEDYALRFFNVRFDGNAADPVRVKSACEYLQTLIGKGVRVVAFRPPVSDSMSVVEDEKSGFEYTEFKKTFSDLGGIWIDVDPAKFKTYDGSHLNSASAREFSKWLAMTIKSRLELMK